MTEGRQLRVTEVQYRVGNSGGYTSRTVTGTGTTTGNHVISRRELPSQGSGN